MNIEDLTKTQLLLLTILVNFVTSIATGVLTVSLLDQAPPTVFQTVNRIVDHTIETVTTEVPVIRNGPSSSVPSSEDLLTAAIAKNAARSVAILRTGSDEPVASGVFVGGSRSVYTFGDLPGTVRVRFSDGSVVEAKEASSDGDLHRYAFEAGATLPSVPGARFVPAAEVKQGQTAIAHTAQGGAVTGIVSRVEEGALDAELPDLMLGAPVVNLSGDVLGIFMGAGRFAGADQLSALPAQ